MKNFFASAGRVLLTLVVVVVAIAVAWQLWSYYMLEPWTRDGVKGLLYFRDPAGNLFEMYCRKLGEAASFARGKKQGGGYEIDFAALNYEWDG